MRLLRRPDVSGLLAMTIYVIDESNETCIYANTYF